MTIAVATDEGKVTAHFGHCEGFTLYKVTDCKVTKKEFVRNPGHRPGFLPVFLHEKGVNLIISGGMGGGAVDIFNEKGIDVIIGVSGDADGIVDSYLKGELKGTGSACREHMH